MDTIEIVINGKTYPVKPESSITDILDMLKLNRNTAIVEYNRNILSKDDFTATIVNGGDSLEIVRFVGGG